MNKLLLPILLSLMGCSATTLENSQDLYKGKGLEVHEKTYNVSAKQRLIAFGPPTVYRYTEVTIKTKDRAYDFFGYKNSKIAKICLCQGTPWLFVNEHRVSQTKEPFGVYFQSSTKCKDYKKSNPRCEGWSKAKSNSQQSRREIDKKAAACDCRIMEPKVKKEKGWTASRERNWKHGYPEVKFVESKTTSKPVSKVHEKHFERLLLTVKGCLSEVERTQSPDVAASAKVHFVAENKKWTYGAKPPAPVLERCLRKRNHMKDLLFELLHPYKNQMNLVVQIEYK